MKLVCQIQFKAFNTSHSTAQVAPDLLKVLAVVMDTAIIWSAVKGAGLKPYCKSVMLLLAIMAEMSSARLYRKESRQGALREVCFQKIFKQITWDYQMQKTTSLDYHG